MKTIIITGGAGFIGSHFIEHLLLNTNWNIIVLDKLTYASNGFSRLREIGAYDNPRVKILTVDLAHPMGGYLEHEIGHVDYIVHMAAETHVDNSIKQPRDFIDSNILGTFELLEYSRRLNLEKFLYFSTDEVFGPAINQSFKEWDRHKSQNPYSATKAAGEELCLAWQNTYNLPVIISKCVNAFGERQHPEKFIPKIVKSLLEGTAVPIHKGGSRFYIHSRNISSAALFILLNGQVGEKYNIAGEIEIGNLELAQMIASILELPLTWEYATRPGCDLRYSLDGSRLAEMGWQLPKTFKSSLEKTINWMVKPENQHWLNLKESYVGQTKD